MSADVGSLKPAASTAIGDTGATIEFDHPDDDGGGVIVSVIYPEKRRRRDRIFLTALLGVACAAPIIAWLIFRRGNDAVWATGVTVVVGGFIVSVTFAQYFAGTRSWVLRAGLSGLDVESW